MNVVEGLVDLLPHLRPREDDLTRDEYEQDDTWFHHAVDESRKKLWLIRAELAMGEHQTFETNRELDVARADHILDLKVLEFGWEPELLNDAGILSGSQPARTSRKSRAVQRVLPSNM